MNRRHVVVVGGGLAGLAAATVLAERGVQVTVVECETFLGGRAGAWADRLEDGTRFHMERGFHAFFRQYYNLRSLMKRVDSELTTLVPLHDYPIFGPEGAKESFFNLPRRAPFNVMELVRRTPTLGFRELSKVNVPRAMEMLMYANERTYAKWDGVTAEAYLDSLRFPADARQMLFEVFAHSFFNPEGEYSAAELLMQFHFYFFGNREGLIFDVMNKPFSRGFIDPLQRYLESRGVRFRLGERVRRLSADGRVVHLAGGDALSGDAVVLAVTVPAVKEIVAASRHLGDPAWRDAIASLDVTWPFVVWRLWLDEAVDPTRQPFVGTAGLGYLDNVSVFEKLEDESAAWADRTGGSVVELHAYAVPPTESETAIRASLRQALDTLYPETRGVRVVAERWLYRRDCPAFAPGSHASRPTVKTPIASLALAGDYVRTDVPCALMERATVTGFEAANALLDQWGAPPEEIRHVALRGLVPTVRKPRRFGKS